MDVAIRFQSITKEFAGIPALRDVTFDVRAGEVHALCGENGAGKSTLIRLLGGAWPAGSYAGDLHVHGERAAFRSVRDAERAGIAVIHQELALVPGMSVAENLLLGREPGRRGIVDRRQMREVAAAQLDVLGGGIDPSGDVGALGVGRQQLVAIAKALVRNARILVLDEPTSALTDTGANALLDILRTLRSRGVTIIYISHRLDEVLDIADRVTVLRDGERVGTWDAEPLSAADIVREMVGRDVAPAARRVVAPASDDRPALSVRAWSVLSPDGAARVRDVSFEAHRGEVLGVAGLMGSGRSELLLSLFGAWPGTVYGDMWIDGVPAAIRRPVEAVARGMALVAEDRRRQGLILGMSVGHNLTLAALRGLSRGGFVRRGRDADEARGLVDRLAVRTPGLATPVRELSGGNQQKVAVGKWLLTRPSVLLLDEPTRGVDVGAKAEIHDLVRGLADEGAAVIMVSSEAPEIMALSDRVLVMREGAVSATFDDVDGLTEADIVAAAISQSPTAGAA
ncbi:sugar ABC transporter ATP-binding protein [Candidatus Poribacteria bacterium]|jgi:D-xylose transport system ATP-binding protein|nr:sugar ABC transporter ATP-binding protein [Candidatus Poribacteria bacterium]MBT5532574.1 sugar ABC transporter ATP-binding protein [Candidatus Poribacteria bacterium]MBT5710058.1 sugar ABC transporter ATP-binding protein [Candidatus Poribacteria bacterium]MBT7099937.1 sugar ABC transporter ATP-binding protein [Candidatus Poribacteria bacterium]MBT7808931.1 sugar ABC transporter ATP-binding protein [Candidatus Poribacteria bacterium]